MQNIGGFESGEWIWEIGDARGGTGRNARRNDDEWKEAPERFHNSRYRKARRSLGSYESQRGRTDEVSMEQLRNFRHRRDHRAGSTEICGDPGHSGTPKTPDISETPRFLRPHESTGTDGIPKPFKVTSHGSHGV
ncbi:hypothetical protein K0M31_003594 [Melipona bicolor]|uniref:Uncharacterized protein n=1 Tax=Melipona bicolor TaxID=60889 RepID=A0AA40KPM1_9HYME|nr:hypothetical protein K0M31_003594 [Melipona bicolor]